MRRRGEVTPQTRCWAGRTQSMHACETVFYAVREKNGNGDFKHERRVAVAAHRGPASVGWAGSRWAATQTVGVEGDLARTSASPSMPDEAAV